MNPTATGKMKRIKVIHIITRLDRGGVTEDTLLTVKGLNRKRYGVKIITGSFTGTEIEVTLIPEMKRVINPFLDILTLFKLYCNIKRERPVIVHTHTSKAGFLGRWAAKLAGVPIIIHTPHGHIFYGYFPFLVTKFFILLEKFTGFITDYIITLTERGKEEYVRYRIGPPAKFIPIYSGIEKRKFAPPPTSPLSSLTSYPLPWGRGREGEGRKWGRLNREEKKELGIPSEVKIVGTIGRLEPVKGHSYFLKAAKLIIADLRFQETRFLLAGSGSLRKKLEREAISLGIKENVLFLGWREDIVEILDILDIFVLPSLNEGMARVILEAMLMAKPVVASNVGGIPDIVEDEKTGLLVPPGDFKGLSEAIIKLLKEPEQAREMGRRGKEKAEKEEFTADGMVKKIEKLYERAINEKRVG
ncbi:MAG: hypothetical protein COS11_07955 [bacterium (Candidatus Ratteibacteria) CG01_land_8_20_14_3_00_40_19]|uniref:Glycosyltransferase family 1 protein n=3 Tax=Candidatus Ratteibacteria TaxID=2979319 RepID=A0A2M7E6L6_9BACT|nr:MAG: hypothetical protein COS11_07955 [bacterium (Candidatus Ratteibacteria) CG01_land_8_20_14_3_00_40_19]